MYNTALRILADTAEAEDVMQEAFLTAFDKLDTFSGEVSFGGWVKRIVVNRALDALRKRKIHLEEIDERSTSIGDDKEETEVIQDKEAMIKKEVANNSETHRELITLHLFEGYPHDEIAEILHMKHGAVRTGYARAKKKLQDELKEMMVY
jgi:RNA polymerase sigma factor (sigma-70 family)